MGMILDRWRGTLAVADVFDFSFWSAFVLHADHTALLHCVGCHVGRTSMNCPQSKAVRNVKLGEKT